MNKAQLATLLTVGFAVAFIGWAVVYLASFPGHPDKNDQLATRNQFRSWLPTSTWGRFTSTRRNGSLSGCLSASASDHGYV